MTPAAALPSLEIHGLSADSRAVASGYLFAALPGTQQDGRKFIGQAVDKGAVAVLTTPDTARSDHGRPVAYVTDRNPRRQLARMSARFYGQQPRSIAAVTGTNGKTSVVDFTRQIWQRLGHEAASLGTLGLIPPRESAPASLTTPDPVSLHRCLAELAGAGIDHLAMEASSIGLDQFRLDGVRVTAAAFTNLTHDHLDYHGGEDAYLAAKSRLFAELLPAEGTAVLNADAAPFEALQAICQRRGIKVLSYGAAGRDLRLVAREAATGGQRLTLTLLGRRASLLLPLAGPFQAANALAALGLVLASGGDQEAALAALEQLNGVPGRIELVAQTPKGGQVFVDYAHTPDALETVLAALRDHASGRLSVVFGCGGDRDRGKRPLMGAVARRLADRAVVTDDNPRSEDPAAIRREILPTAPDAREIGDRRQAIESAMAELVAGDVLVVAGKGHEPGQIVGDRVLPFDDRQVVREAAARLATGQKAGRS